MDAGARANSRLLIVGGGSHESNFRERITSRPELYQGVSMLGEQRAVLKYYKASNHLVLPSRSEGLSNAMVEAMACGLPPVVSNVGGALDLIDDGVNGWFFDVGDPLSLASVLTRANQESSARPQMGIAARQKILNKASIRATAESIESLYEKMTT